jgi:crossover junction endodeoxyribonuclease RusA
MSMNDREHWHKRARRVAMWRMIAAQVARAAKSGTGWRNLPPCNVHLTLDMSDRRRRDPHNFYPTVKACVDGLVDARCWPDDTPEYVTTVEPSFRVVKRGTPLHVLITLTERAA